MSPAPLDTQPVKRVKRRVALPFLIIFFTGFALLASRSIFGIEGLGGETVVPLIGGAVMAIFVALLVVRERKDRAADEGADTDKPPM